MPPPLPSRSEANLLVSKIESRDESTAAKPRLSRAPGSCASVAKACVRRDGLFSQFAAVVF